tara:strand:+ start:627 stop:890 length:264 start_codon:yes stop_codon:yes gene_type:complete
VTSEKRILARITWLDITSKSEPWIHIDEALEMKPAKMQTLGWIIFDNSEYVIIASTLEISEDLAGDVNCIPFGTILEIEKLPLTNPL